MEFTQEQKLYGEIVQKAWEDTQFKSELMADPVGAIEKLTGQKLNLPQGKTLVVRDQTDESTVYINIPAKPATEDVELNEEQLETVAGGATFPGGTIFDIIDILKPTPTFPVPDKTVQY
ncbi:NHLP leader peptide family natural product precursor [Rudanella paleaurantiibacter]|uniref:NHLP leader peptide family natural product n=1 Tax=Rudanella paleaurantiibacter TaxID=2614655 RepID=A0A7J5TS30_9BACT|nr:NHLP leader peptide family RiPP precursor [Rudanella paleaurantiibacter]KAB7725720.1 NHLP leader peptide family natural product precursor [Rudanella paleaurantiibacter]